MTTMVEPPPSPLLSDSSVFDQLPDAEPVISLPGEAPVEDKTPDQKYCPVCEKPITREPGARGRLPKYHPECKPATSGRVRDTITGGRTTRDNAKKNQEAVEAVNLVRAALVKFAIALSMVDKYDGFCVMTAIPTTCDNLKAVLVTHDGLRKDVLAMRSGGSILGLVFSVLLMLVPIAAHHGIIPKQWRISQMLVNLPVVLHKIAQRMREGEEALNDMMERVADSMLKESEKTKEEKEPKADQNGYAPSST